MGAGVGSHYGFLSELGACGHAVPVIAEAEAERKRQEEERRRQEEERSDPPRAVLSAEESFLRLKNIKSIPYRRAYVGPSCVGSRDKDHFDKGGNSISEDCLFTKFSVGS